MKSYKEFILENKSEKSKFIINKFNSYVKEDNFTDTKYLYRTYNKIYDKNVLVIAKNIYLSNTLNIKERRKIDYYLYLTNQKFEDAFNNYYTSSGLIQESIFSKTFDWIEKGALKASNTIADATKSAFEKTLKGVKTVLDFGEKIYNQFLEGFGKLIGKLEEYANSAFNIASGGDKTEQFTEAMIEYIKVETEKKENYFELLIKGGESLFILFKNLAKKIASKLKEFFVNLFSKEKINDSYTYESFISYQLNEGLTGNFFDNITNFIKTSRPFSWLIELGEYLENLTGKIMLKIKSKIVEFIKDISDQDMLKDSGFVKNKNESSNNDNFLLEGFSSKFAVSSSRPLILALDMMQIYTMIYAKGENKKAEEWLELSKSIISGDLLGSASEGFKKLTQGALTTGKAVMNGLFPWIMPVIKGVSLFFTLYGLWKKIKPIVIKAKDKIKTKISTSGATASVPTKPTASTPGGTASTPGGTASKN
jgi:hypothetical protein